MAERLVHFLDALARESDLLSRWFLKGNTRASARTPLELDVGAVAFTLKVNRRDVGGEVIPELGFSLGVWNGRTADVSATMGAYSRYVGNSVVLSFSHPPANFGAKEWKSLVEIAVRELDPDHAVVTSSEYLRKTGAQDPWEAGWFIFRRGGTIDEHPFE